MRMLMRASILVAATFVISLLGAATRVRAQPSMRVALPMLDQEPLIVHGDCTTDPDPAAAPHTPLRIEVIEKDANPERAVLRNVSTQDISLAGWQLCSIKGNQEHTLPAQVIPAGQVARVPNASGVGTFIWNNAERDDAALYDPTGRLVSYWSDPDPEMAP
jgi:hypothetical protein